MAPKADHYNAETTPSPTKKTSKIWKRLGGSGNNSSSSKLKSKSKSSNTSSASPTTVTATMPMVAITVNGVTTCAAVAADVIVDQEKIVEASPPPPKPITITPILMVEDHGGNSNSPLVTTTFNNSNKYTMPDKAVNHFATSLSSSPAAVNTIMNTNAATNNNNNSNINSTASYFNSFISGHRLSFSEEESTDNNDNDNDNNNGLVIQEVLQTSSSFGWQAIQEVTETLFGQPMPSAAAVEQSPFLNVNEQFEEKWTPFGTDEDEDVVVEMVKERSEEKNGGVAVG